MCHLLGLGDVVFFPASLALSVERWRYRYAGQIRTRESTSKIVRQIVCFILQFLGHRCLYWRDRFEKVETVGDTHKWVPGRI